MDCVICEEPIPEARLAVLPNTKVCLNCQQEREAKGHFKRSHMEITQAINGWQFDGVETKLVKGE